MHLMELLPPYEKSICNTDPQHNVYSNYVIMTMNKLTWIIFAEKPNIYDECVP